VVDSSDPDPMGSIDAVRHVLNEIGAADVPELYVFNKADMAPVEAARLAAREPDSVVVSAVTGNGVPELLAEVANRLRAVTSLYSLLVPFDRGDILAMVHREGEVLSETADEDGWSLEARLDDGSAGRLDEFVVDSDRPGLSG